MSKIVAVSHDETGALESFQLEDGRVLNRDQAVDAADKGEIAGVSSFTTRNGDKAIRSDRGQEGYSLDDLPEIDQVE